MRILGGAKVRSVVLAAAVGIAAVVVPAAPAAAATCTLTIKRLVPGPEFYDVQVACTGVQEVFGFNLYGSDGWPNPDDYLTHLGASGGTVNGDILNEDVGARDEIYAKVRYRDLQGKERSVNSNRVDGYFGCVIDVAC